MRRIRPKMFVLPVPEIVAHGIADDMVQNRLPIVPGILVSGANVHRYPVSQSPTRLVANGSA
jgi:hypothetical protein